MSIKNARQRRREKERVIALNAWYSCIIAMGSVPKDENLYFETFKRFKQKYRIPKNHKIKTTCDNEYQDIKNAYIEKNLNNQH